MPSTVSARPALLKETYMPSTVSKWITTNVYRLVSASYRLNLR